MDNQALSGVKVLDLTHHITGPYCTKLLADYGADVIKVERPGSGDIARNMGPFFKDEPHPEKSGLFLHLNTNKRSVTLNLKSETGKEIFSKLVKEADILVENFEPRVMPSLGLGYDEIVKVNPRIVMTSISNFGQSGPYRDFKASELIIYGMGGAMYSSGHPEKEPQRLASTFILYQAGIAAANATVAALFVNEFQGEGQHVDVAITEAIAAGVDRLHAQLVAYEFNREIQPRIATAFGAILGVGPYPCKDGYVELVLLGALYVERTRNLLGHPGFLENPKWDDASLHSDPAFRDQFNAYYINWLSDKTKKEVIELAEKNNILCAPLNTIEDIFNDPHFTERETFIEIEHPMTGPLKYAARPFRMSETPWQFRMPAPLLGEHNEGVYQGIGYSKADLVRLKEQGVI